MAGCTTIKVTNPNDRLAANPAAPTSVAAAADMLQKMSYYGHAIVTEKSFRNYYENNPRDRARGAFRTCDDYFLANLTVQFAWNNVTRIALVSHFQPAAEKPFLTQVCVRVLGTGKGTKILGDEILHTNEFVTVIAAFGEMPGNIIGPCVDEWQRNTAVMNEQPMGKLPEYLCALKMIIGPKWPNVTTEALNKDRDPITGKQHFNRKVVQ